MTARPPHLDFDGLKQVVRFEVSRFPYLPESQQHTLRKAYRELEATLRDGVRELEFGWGSPAFVTPRILIKRLETVQEGLETILTDYARSFSPELRDAVEKLIHHIRQMRTYVGEPEAEVERPIEELSDGIDDLKRALGTIHRM